jgi:ribonucleotide monophosphatase NagD (HAD superfamily)
MAALYRDLGGQTAIAGKPHTPIYKAAIAKAEALRGPVAQSRILAVGDGMPTDVRGAIDFGLELLYVSAGIHGHAYMRDGKTDVEALETFLADNGAAPRWWIPRLA